MGQDRKASRRSEKKKKKEDDESNSSMAPEQVTDRKKAEEDGRPVQKSTAKQSKEKDTSPKSRSRKRKTEEDNPLPETDKKRRKKEEEDEKPAQKSTARQSKKKDGDLNPKTRSSSRKVGEVCPSTETGQKKRKKEKEDLKPAQKSTPKNNKEKNPTKNNKETDGAKNNKEKSTAKNNKEKSTAKNNKEKSSAKKNKEKEGDLGPKTRSSSRKEKEGGPAPCIVAVDQEPGSKRRKKEEEDGRPPEKPRAGEREETEGELTPETRSSKRKKKEEKEDGKSAPKSRRMNKKKNGEESIEARSEQGVVASFSHLPDLVEDKVVEFLGLRDKVRLARVSSSWRDAVYRPRHWDECIIKGKMTKSLVEGLKKRQIGGLTLTPVCKGLKRLLIELDHLDFLELSSWNTATLLRSLSGERFESLTTLYLETRRERQVKSLIRGLQCFPNLESLNVEGVATTPLLEAIADQLKHINTLCLWNQARTPLNGESLGRMSRLEHLELDKCQFESLEFMGRLSSTLKELILERCDMPDDWAVMLSQLGSLVELTLENNYIFIDEDRLRLVLQSLPKLKGLICGSRRRKLSDAHMRVMAEKSGLLQLGLSSGHVGSDRGILELCGSLRHLTRLILSECNRLTTLSIEHISGLPALMDLTLENCKDGSNWLRILAAGSCRLKRLFLDAFGNTEQGIVHLAQMSSLENLSIERTNIGVAGMVHLSSARFCLQSLSILFGAVTLAGLTPFLRTQASLRTLTLVEETGMGKAALSPVKTFLPHLEECVVFNWNLGKHGWPAFYRKMDALA